MSETQADIMLPGGELVEVTDLDGMIAALTSIRERIRELKQSETSLRLAIVERATAEIKTRYVRGEHKRAKVEMPSRKSVAE